MARRWGPRRKSPDAAERGFIEPCLATLKEAPPAEGPWIHEIKYDGYRMMARQGDDGPMLFTRNGFDWTERFGETIADAIDALPSTGAYLDGEVVVEDARGISSFAMLQDDLQRGRADRLVYYAFDLLLLDGEDLRDQPLARRKAALAKLLKKLPAGGVVRLGRHYEDPEARKVLAESCRLGLEGILSKRADRPYRSGRSLDWIKSRCMEQEVFVIGGYETSKTVRGQLAALVVGKRAGRTLHYKGHVGTGFSRTSSAELLKRLKPLVRKANPFADELEGVTFVEPALSAEIDYRGLTGDGRVRHASFRGVVEGKKAPAKPKLSQVAKLSAKRSRGGARSSFATTPSTVSAAPASGGFSTRMRSTRRRTASSKSPGARR